MEHQEIGLPNDESRDLLESFVERKFTGEDLKEGKFLLIMGKEIMEFPIPKQIGVWAIDDASSRLFAKIMKRKIPNDPEAHASLLKIARTILELGVNELQLNHLDKAYFSFRVSLALAVRCEGFNDVLTITDAIWRLCEFTRGLITGKERIISPQIKPESIPMYEDQVRRQSGVLLSRIEVDNRWIYSRLSKSIAKFNKSTSDKTLTFFECLRRCSNLANLATERRKLLQKVYLNAERKRNWNIALRAIIEELAETNAYDIAVSKGFISNFDSKERPDLHEYSGFTDVWTLYQAARRRLAAITQEHKNLVKPLFLAYQQFEFLRLNQTFTGGQYGHRLSYVLSEFLQDIGRDLATVLVNSGLSGNALETAEHTHSRAMTDWMARTHHTNRLMLGKYDYSHVRKLPVPMLAGNMVISNTTATGSVNAVYPANIEEIMEVAVKMKLTILTYLRVQDAYIVWLQRPTGEIYMTNIKDPSHLIRELLELFPYVSSSQDLSNLVGRKKWVKNRRGISSGKDLRRTLSRLFEALIPEPLWSVLPNEGGSLVIIAEGMLEYVPFCALVTKDGSFLVQRCSIRYWPSVTAFLLIQTAEQARRVGKKTALNALVLADPLFKPSYSIHFKSGIVKKIHPTRLPGTRLEAKSIQRILKIRPRVGALATSESLFANTKSVLDEKSPGIKIVHIASHGFVDTNNPENSFLLFSDTAITAKQLYNYDPGLKVELVVLSACQTALGKSHPDSMIGLSNAFLIAGANSVVSTLWRVHDRTVPRIMRKFYQSIAKGDNIDISLRNAQLTALRCVDTRNPVYWAAFKLIGSSANPLNVRRHQTQA